MCLINLTNYIVAGVMQTLDGEQRYCVQECDARKDSQRKNDCNQKQVKHYMNRSWVTGDIPPTTHFEYENISTYRLIG